MCGGLWRGWEGVTVIERIKADKSRTCFFRFRIESAAWLKLRLLELRLGSE